MEDKDDDVELSPGFFDMHNNSDNDSDNDDVMPSVANIESLEETNNVVLDFFYLIFVTKSTSCECANDGWKRLSTY